MEIARKFYGKFLPQLGFVEQSSGKKYHTFYSAAGYKPSEFFCLEGDKNHKPNGTRIAFWADICEEVDRLEKLVRKVGGRARKSAEVTVPATARFSSRIRGQQAGNLLPRTSDHCDTSAVSTKR
jgi:hypothetical protein